MIKGEFEIMAKKELNELFSELVHNHHVKNQASIMLNDLNEHYLKVILAGNPESHSYYNTYYRYVEDRNPLWYKELWLCYAYTRNKRCTRMAQSNVKRSHIVRILKDISKGIYKPWPWWNRIMELIIDMLENGYNDDYAPDGYISTNQGFDKFGGII